MTSPIYSPVSASSVIDEPEIQDQTTSPTRRYHGQPAAVDTRDGFRHTSPPLHTVIPRKPVAAAAIGPAKVEEQEKPHDESRAPGSSAFDDWWLLEILGALLSLLWLAAIIIVLSLYKEKPLSQWNLPIRVNSLISLFASLAKAAILLPVAACIGQLKWRHFASRSRQLTDFQTFDSASQGPLGAFNLIIRLKGTSVMATCSSVIIVISLAIDPFAQQIISYPIRTVPVANNSASILQTQIYDTQLPSINRFGTSVFTDIRMQGAIYRGLYGLPGETLYKCPTGNCNWTSLATFGVCSKCVTVTDQTNRTCFTYIPNAQGGVFEQTDPNSTNGLLRCGYYTPSGFHLQGWSANSAVGPYNTVFNSSALVGNRYDTNSTVIASIAALRIPDAGELRLPWEKSTSVNSIGAQKHILTWPSQMVFSTWASPSPRISALFQIGTTN